MSLVPGISNPYLAAFAGGLFYGLVFCTSACLPYVASYVAGIGAGFRRGIVVTLTYNTGRIAAYAMIGGAIGILSGSFRFFVDQSSLLPLQQYSSVAFGIVTIIIGASILMKSRNLSCDHTEQQIMKQHVIKPRKFDFGAFSLGLSRGLIVCPALLVLLLYSLTFGTPIDSLALAVLFGLGTGLSPLLLLGGATGWLLNKAPLFRKWISRLGAITLMLMGIGTMVTTMVTSG
ncbi:MAG TPA: sulfite exporter TauE/SafE family protein [Candidatus Sulfotelmatobacter sp.]|jgi:sulfite exporter TauE/SafE|nr:sulfite exporter TauE/SafE family protein [Candidatus Sulfotelmatobacter sp.]